MPDCHSKGKKRGEAKGLPATPAYCDPVPLMGVLLFWCWTHLCSWWLGQGAERNHNVTCQWRTPVHPLSQRRHGPVSCIGLGLNWMIDLIGLELDYRNGFKWWNSFDFSWWLAKSSFSDNHEIWMSDRLKPYHSPVKTWGSFGWLSWNGFPCCKRNNTISLN